MGTIDDAIRASREREEKATKVNWSGRPIGAWDEVACISVDEKTRHDLGTVLFVGRFGDGRDHESRYFGTLDDAYFIQEARTWEPRFRDALQLATRYLQACADEKLEGNKYQAAQAIEEITKILEGGEK